MMDLIVRSSRLRIILGDERYDAPPLPCGFMGEFELKAQGFQL